MLDYRYIVRIEHKNLRAETWINGIPIGFFTPKDASPIAIPLNPFMVQGRNKIGVVLHAADIPSASSKSWAGGQIAGSYTGQAELSAHVGRYSLDQTALGDKVPPLTTISWQGSAETNPKYTENEFMSADPLGPWAWESAAHFAALDQGLRARAVEYLLYLHSLLKNRLFDRFLEQCEIKLTELTKGAYGISAEPLRRSMLEGLTRYSSPPFQLESLMPKDIDLRLVAGGRMIECLRSNRRYILEYRQAGSDESFFLPTMIGQIKGGWHILR